MLTASDTSSDSSEDHSLKEDVNRHDRDDSDQLQDACDGHDDFGKDIGHVNIEDRQCTSNHGYDGGLDGHDIIHDSEIDDNADVYSGGNNYNDEGYGYGDDGYSDNDDDDEEDDDDDDDDIRNDDDDDDDIRNDDDDDQEKHITPSATLSRGDRLPTVPLYQGAPISVKASWLAANYFAVTNNLSDSTTKQLLDLIAIHCPETNSFATSTFQLRNKLNCDEADIFMYCSRCMNKIVMSNKCLFVKKKKQKFVILLFFLLSSICAQFSKVRP